ncbi:MAG TPA: lipoate--protein ligase family protein, partial [Micrococcaceae bacterium]
MDSTEAAAASHGEYKVPGGKLVVADLAIADGLLTGVSISGDFFLEPDDVLGAINAALEGFPAESGAPALEEVVTAALPAEAVLFGFSARAVAIAVRRALSKATSWADHEWE